MNSVATASFAVVVPKEEENPTINISSKRKREDVEDEAAQLAKRIKVLPYKFCSEEESSEEPKLEAKQAIKHEEPSTQDQEEYIKTLQDAKDSLRKHFETPFLCAISGLLKYPSFIFQRAPKSVNGAGCRFVYCEYPERRVFPGQYRYALTLGMGYPLNPDEDREVYTWYYHIDCFLSLVDFSSLYHAERFAVGGQKFPADRGAECLAAEFISRWKQKLHKHQNIESPGDLSLENTIKKEEEPDLLKSTAIKTEESAEGANVWAVAEEWQDRSISCYLYKNDDISFDELRSWDIEQCLLPESHPQYSERHALSQALKAWDKDRKLLIRLTMTPPRMLNSRGRLLRALLPIEKIRPYLYPGVSSWPSQYFPHREETPTTPPEKAEAPPKLIL